MSLIKSIEKKSMIAVLLLGILATVSFCKEKGPTSEEEMMQNFLLGFGATLTRPRSTPPISGANSVASLEEIDLGGVKQWILVRGQDTSKPVLLFLHGGPGSSMIGNGRFFLEALESDYVVVNWDQRGAGISYSPNLRAEDMTVDRLRQDTVELTNLLRTRFSKSKIYLVGHSWGSLLGMLAVKSNPELYSAFVGVGQFVNEAASDAYNYQFVMSEAASKSNQTALSEMQALGPPPYNTVANITTLRKWTSEYGGDIHNKQAMQDFASFSMAASEYNLGDWLNQQNGAMFSLNSMLQELITIDLRTSASTINVPAYFFLGRYDHVCAWEVAQEYYNLLVNPAGKQLFWFENSAHNPLFEERDKFVDLMRNTVLPLK